MLTTLARYPDVLRDLKGFRTISVDALDICAECVCYVQRKTERRGVRWLAGTIRERKRDSVKVWLSKHDKCRWIPITDVRVVVAA